MDFYFNIVTVVNFPHFCYQCYYINCLLQKACKDLLSGIVTVTMETMTNQKGTQALQFSDDDFTTGNPVTHVNTSTTDTHVYSIPWIFLIVLLSMLVIFA